MNVEYIQKVFKMKDETLEDYTLVPFSSRSSGLSHSSLLSRLAITMLLLLFTLLCSSERMGGIALLELDCGCSPFVDSVEKVSFSFSSPVTSTPLSPSPSDPRLGLGSMSV